MTPKPQTAAPFTLAVIIGSSTYGGESGPAQGAAIAQRLVETARELNRYLCDHDGLALPAKQIYNLFDSQRTAEDQLRDLADFLDRFRSVNADDHHVLVFFVGHGIEVGSDNAMFVVAKSSPQNWQNSAIDPDVLSGTLVGHGPSSSRFFMYLDCCYARKLQHRMKFLPLSYTQDVAAPVESDELHRGVVVLSASDVDEQAFAPPSDSMTRMATMFFEALSEPSASLVSMEEIHRRMLEVAKTRFASGAWKRGETSLPEIQNQRAYVDNPKLLPLFRTGWRQPKALFSFPAGSTAKDAAQLRILVVGREKGSDKLVSAVQNLAVGYARELAKASGKAVPPLEDKTTFFFDVASAFDSEADLVARLTAVAQADLVFFDCSESDGSMEPGVMLFLGVRSVVARGITICGLDRKLAELHSVTLPFNLQHLNIVSHHTVFDRDARGHLGQKVVRGFREFSSSPTYLDLPIFDAIRNLGSSADRYAPVQYFRSPLYLGPFAPEFQEQCYQPFCSMLETALRPIAEAKLPGRSFKEPEVRRLLNDETTQLVTQSLCHAIRAYEFCLIDWTLLRPNVFFEFGVRLASNPLGAVHIMATPNERVVGIEPAPNNQKNLRQVERMKLLFRPIEYHPWDASGRLRKDVDAILAQREQNARISARTNRFYAALGEAMPVSSESAVKKVAASLSERAAFEFIYDQSDLRATALFSDVNMEIQAQALASAASLHLSALFLRVSSGSNADAPDLLHALVDLQRLVEELSDRGIVRTEVAALKRGMALLRKEINAKMA